MKERERKEEKKLANNTYRYVDNENAFFTQIKIINTIHVFCFVFLPPPLSSLSSTASSSLLETTNQQKQKHYYKPNKHHDDDDDSLICLPY